MRICIDARLISGTCGGVEQVIIGLASGLSSMVDGDEEYLFLVYTDEEEWLRPYVQGPCRMLYASVPSFHRLRQWLCSTMPVVRDAWQELRHFVKGGSISLPHSDNTIEKAGIDIMHFTMQIGFLTDVPSIYQPHDLQHLHLPQFFSRRECIFRDAMYRALCQQARIVSVMTAWGRQDLIKNYGLPEDKVQIVPWAPVQTAYPSPSEDDLIAARQKFNLPEAFIFYPAQTWEHKNHIGLLEALAILRDQYNTTVPFVASGHLNDFFPKINKRARELQLTHQIKFLGFVSPLELQCLYKLCRFMVFPTKFEGWGMPVLEAFLAGVAVACSDVTSLPELVTDAAVIFNPGKPEEITSAIHRLWTDEALRKILIERGKKRVTCYSWDRTARIFRAHYRRIANRPLNDQDRELLETPLLV